MKRIYFITLLLVSALGVKAQTAANSVGTQTTKLALSNAIELTFASGSGGISSMEFTSLNHLVNGVQSTQQDLIVKSNKTFDVFVSSPAANFTYTGTSTTNNVISVSSALEINCTQAAGGTIPGQTGTWKSFNPLTPTTLLTDCDPGGNQTFSVKYRATPGITSAPGSYVTNVVFTATQQ